MKPKPRAISIPIPGSPPACAISNHSLGPWYASMLVLAAIVATAGLTLFATKLHSADAAGSCSRCDPCSHGLQLGTGGTGRPESKRVARTSV